MSTAERVTPAPVLPWVALAAVYLFWGSTYLGIRIAVETMPPFTMAGSRYLIAGALLYPFARRRARTSTVTREHWIGAAVVGGLLLVGGNGLLTYGEQTVPSGIAALLVATVPLWMVLLDRASGRQRLRAPVTAGLLLGLAGIALLVRPWADPEVDRPGALIILVASMLWAIGSLRSRSATLPQDPLVATGMQMLAGGAMLVLLGAVTGELGRLEVSGISWASVGAFTWLVGPGSIVAFSAYVYALRTLPTATVATYAYVNPVVAVVLGWVILDEQHTVGTLGAGAVIAIAVVLIVRVRTGEAQHVHRGPSHASPRPASQGAE